MPDEHGSLKVFIGMAPGVGKTYRMLQEGSAEAESGRDVVVGYLESHGRAETVAQAEGLEIVLRGKVVYRGTPLEEMDLPAVLARKPELCLIDELAHTNAPGVEHEKRYEDVREVIEAGIDVYSTVNVQHLESLNDQITQLTGSITRETIPDENLAALRETALRQVAEDEGDDVAAVAVRLARSLGSTYVLLGAPSSPRGLRRLGAGSSDRALPMRLLRGLPGVDIRIIADPALRGQAGEGETFDEAGG